MKISNFLSGFVVKNTSYFVKCTKQIEDNMDCSKISCSQKFATSFLALNLISNSAKNCASRHNICHKTHDVNYVQLLNYARSHVPKKEFCPFLFFPCNYFDNPCSLLKICHLKKSSPLPKILHSNIFVSCQNICY